MEEDVAGLQEAGIRRGYTTCAQCGEPFLKRAASPHESNLVEGTHSSFADVCPRCERDLQSGEGPALAAEDL